MAHAEQFVRDYQSNRARLEQAGVDVTEHDACGVGLVASLDGTARRDVVVAGIEALKVLFHRGAVDADGKTGDGAGIHVELPQEFFKDHIRHVGHQPEVGHLAVGMIFLPKADLAAQERCRCIVETEIINFGYKIYGWRQVPINVSVIGDKANATRPEIEQIMIANTLGRDDERFETDLYIIRRRIEKQVLAEHINDFYVCSLSCRSIIYKGMFLAEQLTTFYPDLLDERFISRFAIYHQRYSTNTFPTWRLAQPFRMLAHNGEINTLSGNLNWMKAHEPRMDHPQFGNAMEDLKPIVQAGGSDSAALDNVVEIMCRAGRPVPLVKLMLVPESTGAGTTMAPEHRNFFSYCNAVIEPWDGPAALCMTDGRWLAAGLDRNGLRPMRFTITKDKLLIIGSETGMVRIPEADILEKGRVGPGQTLAVELSSGTLFRDKELKDLLAARQPYGDWAQRITELDQLVQKASDHEPLELNRDELLRRQMTYGLTLEDMELILQPMAETGKEAIGSMGDDAPLAVLSEQYRGLHHFFRQNFSQVTNPPIDSLRESRVMTLRTRLGNLGNILDESETQCDLLQLESPVLSNAEFDAMRQYMGDAAAVIDCTYTPAEGEHALRDGLNRIRREAEEAVRAGHTHLILSDKGVSADRAPLPMILATGGVHSHLVRERLRTWTSLNVQSGECLDVHYFAVLIGVGATTVNAYLAQEAIADRWRRGLLPGLDLETAVHNYKKAIDQGLLKIMSKLGISVVSSYRGGCNFEAIGLSRSLVAEFFPGMTSRISGIGLNGIERKATAQHALGFAGHGAVLPIGGFYRFRRNQETHAYEGSLIHTLQTAVQTESYTTYKKYSDGVKAQPPITIRDLLDFVPAGAPVSLDEVESITEIRKRFLTPGMSLGALSPEAHGTLNIAMNRIGAKSVSGEGGEFSERYRPQPNGDNANSAVKQIASGRFGVTAEYLTMCREIEIKAAQGAKPGEGGQLPGFKVTAEIAKLRHATEGVMLISPPPHHDIYSIEDLAQLIYDLKQINPTARVTVKLVSRSGIGTIAAGVAKAMADTILVSGNVGGTGASPQTSIKFAGLPWELGLSEVHQVLTLNRLRHRVKLRTDGGLKTGRDIVIAAMLGAEEFGIGTASLVALGCIMVRQCHSNTCPVGVCTQDKALREKFSGSPDKVVNLFSFIAEEVREILASLGARSLSDIIGRTDLLRQVTRGSDLLDDLDLNPLLAQVDAGGHARYCTQEERNEVPDSLDIQIIKDARPLLIEGEKMQLDYNVRNVQRAIGTRLSHHITRKYGMTGLQDGHLTVRLRGSCGQSLGAFAVRGLKLEVFGDSNDYVGKGLSGGTIVVRPPVASTLPTNANTIIGNTVLYGATAGRLFAAGQAGERFAVRNSGATAVVEGCGSNGCEYMTGGTVAILGPVGANFGAGMTGGMAFVYDADGEFASRVNPESVVWQEVEAGHWEAVLRSLIGEHAAETGSKWAQEILANWPSERKRFVQIIPREMLTRLEHPVSSAKMAKAS